MFFVWGMRWLLQVQEVFLVEAIYYFKNVKPKLVDVCDKKGQI